MEECVVAIVAVQYPFLYRAAIKNELDEILAKHDPFSIMKQKKGKKAWNKIIDALIKKLKIVAKSSKNDAEPLTKKKRFRPRKAGRGARQVSQAGSQAENATGRGGFKPRGGFGFGRGRGRG